MRFSVLLLISLWMTGCAATTQYAHTNSDGSSVRVTELGNSNAIRPGYTIALVEKCIQPGSESGKEHCQQLGLFHTSTSGWVTSLLQPAAMVGSAYLLADGIRDSAARTNVNNNSRSRARAKGGAGGAGGNARALGGKGGNGYGGNARAHGGNSRAFGGNANAHQSQYQEQY
ncbi:MAG: hypothetical protein ACE5E9_06505, partial [Nitrospinaceae bacterium]